MRLLLIPVLASCVLGCASDPPPPARTTEAIPTRADDPGPPPTVPPKPLVNKDAFYIISIPAPAPAAGAKICANDADCNALLPKDPPHIARYWTDESWVVVTTPAGHHVSNVVSDGAAATVILEKPCPGFEPRLVLWRVAPTVKTVTTAPGATPPACPPK